MNEIERKFLTTSYHLAVVRGDEILPNYSHRLWLSALGATSVEIAHIQQIYLDMSIDKQGYMEREERIRKKIKINEAGEEADRLFYYTTKRGSGTCRKEKEIEISEDEFEMVREALPYQKPTLEKIRTTIEIKGVVIEIDRYLGNLGGLCVSEVEFADLAAAANFEPEQFREVLGEEVSGRSELSNASLALTEQIPSWITLPRYLAPSIQP